MPHGSRTRVRGRCSLTTHDPADKPLSARVTQPGRCGFRLPLPYPASTPRGAVSAGCGFPGAHRELRAQAHCIARRVTRDTQSGPRASTRSRSARCQTHGHRVSCTSDRPASEAPARAAGERRGPAHRDTGMPGSIVSASGRDWRTRSRRSARSWSIHFKTIGPPTF